MHNHRREKIEEFTLPHVHITRKSIPLLCTIAIVCLVILATAFWNMVSTTLVPQSCPSDVHMCEDGTIVHRDGPYCMFSACAVAPVQTTGDVVLGIGQSGSIGNVVIRLNAFIQDSRCPLAGACADSGAVFANVTLKENGLTQTRIVSSSDGPYAFGDSKISIVDVAPPKTSDADILPNEYKVTFHIFK